MTESLKNSSEELLLSFVKDVVDKPEIFISQNSEVASKITNVVKSLYDTAKKHEPLPLGPIPELLTEGFDYEQIWEEIQLQNQPLLEYVDTQLEELSTEQDQAVTDSESSESADSDAQVPDVSGDEDEDMSADEEEAASDEDLDNVEGEEEDESLEDNEANSDEDNIDPERSEVDDDFFSLSQMETFTEKAEEMELQENSDEEDEIDYFADPDELSDTDDEGTNANDITYGEFFKDGKKRPSKSDSSNDKKKVRFAEKKEVEGDAEEDDKEPETNTKDLFEQDANEDDEDGEKLSSFEKHQRKIQDTIAQLEEENVAAKDWTLMGEASVKTRPVNSLLEEDLEFDHASKPVPVITQEVTETLEDMIKRRILDNIFDDVERKKDPNLPAFKPSKMVELNDEKSKKSLSELYEEEYVKQTTGNVVNEKDEALKKTHDEIDGMFKDLCFKLDSLTNFHFTPKMPKAEITVISDAPAISMEEVTPVNVSDANLLAPEEVYEKPSQKKNRKKKSNN